jgi:hypothetical protein
MLANEGFERCENYMRAWLHYADTVSGLIPRNIEAGIDYWNAKDAAADNYPFLVLTAYFTDQGLFRGRMRDMLDAEKRLTSRVGTLPDTYSFSKRGFLADTAKMDEIVFGTSEYIKDGLLPLTEWLGSSPWSDRMLEMLHDLGQHVRIAGSVSGDGFGNASREEVNGELLQVLSRMYWTTGEEQLLDWAITIGDYYLLGDHHPTRDLEYLRLRDHGCELVSGLCELYATTHFARPDKGKTYQRPLHEMLDRILEVGRNEDGLFYDGIDPIHGKIIHQRIADTWGYTLNGFYTVFLMDSVWAYREATTKVFANLNKYRSFDWEHGSADGYADAIESALNLYNRLRDENAARWIDSEIQVMWKMQQTDGMIEGWHGDGNFARTTIMYNLWKSKGLHVIPWRRDVLLGAAQKGDSLLVTISASAPWSGKLYFDKPRSRMAMKLPLDWPRINQFPEWYTVENERTYSWVDISNRTEQKRPGEELTEGVDIAFSGEKKLIVFPDTLP